MSVAKAREAVKKYRETEARNNEYVRSLWEKAEESGDFYDYQDAEEASRNFYECMTEAADGLMRDIEEALK